MKNQDWQNRKTENYPVGGRGRVTRQLPLGGKMKKLSVILNGTFTTTAGGGANGTARFPEAPLVGLFQRIRVRLAKAPGSRYPDGVIRDYNPRTILRRATFSPLRKKFIGDLYAGAYAGGVVAAQKVYISFDIDFAQDDLRRPIETALNCDSDAYQSVIVEVDTGNQDDTFLGNTRVWDFSALRVDFVDDREAVDGDTYVLVETDHEVLIPGASTRFEDKNMPQDGSLLDLLLFCQNGSSSGSPTYVDDILNKIIIAGANIDAELKFDDIHQGMFKLGYADAAQSVTGNFLVPFIRDGMLTKAVPAAGLNLKFDVANPRGSNLDSILVTARRLFAPDGYKPITPGSSGRY